jgi:hypothetical protein
MSQVGDGYDAQGVDGALAVLAEAVDQGNGLLGQLASYTAAGC